MHFKITLGEVETILKVVADIVAPEAAVPVKIITDILQNLPKIVDDIEGKKDGKAN